MVELWLSVTEETVESGFHSHMIKGDLGLFMDIVRDV